MASVQLWLDLGQTPELRTYSPVAQVWMQVDDKTRDELVSRLARLMAKTLEKVEVRDE